MSLPHPTPLSRAHKRFLRSLFPAEGLLLAPEAMHVYGIDASRSHAMPQAVVRPSSVEQVQRLLAWADAETIPVYTRGRATNVVGGCVPERGGVVLSTLHLNRILEIDAHDFVAVVQPGVITGELQKEARAKGLLYAPDPASAAVSSIGGNVATNAGGMRAVKYGVTRDAVLGLEAVLPGGRIIRTGTRTHKDVAGLDLTSLLVGSEGTLGVVTRAWLKLLPAPPQTASVLAFFPELETALEAAQAVFMAGMLPVALEFLDRDVLGCIRQIAPLPKAETAAAALLIQVDGVSACVAAQKEAVETVCTQAGATTLYTGLGSQEEQRVWQARRLINQASFRIAPHKFSQDVTVPRGRLGPCLQAVKQIVAEEGVSILTFGHLGDGNIHTNIMYDKGRQSQRQAVGRASRRILRFVLELEGSLSGEHGIGRSRWTFVHEQIGREQQSLMRRVKHVFDPNAILNPDKGY